MDQGHKINVIRKSAVGLQTSVTIEVFLRTLRRYQTYQTLMFCSCKYPTYWDKHTAPQEGFIHCLRKKCESQMPDWVSEIKEKSRRR